MAPSVGQDVSLALRYIADTAGAQYEAFGVTNGHAPPIGTPRDR